MTRNRILLAAAAASLVLGLGSTPARALTLSLSLTNNTSDNDGDGREDAASSSDNLSAIHPLVLADLAGSTGTVEGRFTGISESESQDGSITQSVDVTITYTIAAASIVTYDLTLAPEFHGYLRMQDGAADESGDSASFSARLATLKLDSVTIADTLGLGSSSSRSTDGTTNVNGTATQTLFGLSGSHTIELRYTFSASADAADGLACDNQTWAIASWGQTGTLGSECHDDALNNVSSGDGLYLPATLTITAIPEPGTLLLVGSGLLGLAGFGRRRD